MPGNPVRLTSDFSSPSSTRRAAVSRGCQNSGSRKPERSIGFASGAGCRGPMRVSFNAHGARRVCGLSPPGLLHAEPQRFRLQQLKCRIPMSRESAESKAIGCIPVSAGHGNRRSSAGFRGYLFMAATKTSSNKRTASSLSRHTKVKHH